MTVRRHDVTEPITIRHSAESDRARVLELAELDGRPAPTGEMLLADPFERSGEVEWLLQMRAEQERVMRAPGSLVGRLMTVRQHAGAIA
jgi:hypothetical protein